MQQKKVVKTDRLFSCSSQDTQVGMGKKQEANEKEANVERAYRHDDLQQGPAWRNGGGMSRELRLWME